MGEKSNPFLSSINSGEFSPRMEARVDFDRYPNAAKMCRNLLLLPQGGMTRRPGSRFVKEVKTSSLDTVVIPFQFSESDAWILEAGNLYFRFYRRQARVDLTAVSTAVTNGTFTGNANGWTLGGSAAYASNAVTMVEGSTVVQALTIGAGDQNVRHVVGFQLSGVGTVDLTITSGAAASLASQDYAEGYHIIEFTPTDGTATLTFTGLGSTKSVASTCTLDNVSICGTALELVTPYLTADIHTLRVFQAADVAYILHPDYKTYRLERYGTYTWSLISVSFIDGPWLSSNSLSTDIETFDVTVKQRIANPFFENGLVGWTDSSTGDGHIFFTVNGAELDDGTAAGVGVAKLRTSFSGAADASDFILHIYVVNQATNLNVGTAAGGATIVSAQVLNAGWNNVQISSTAATIHVEFTISGHTGERSAIAICTVYGSTARLLDADATTGNATVTSIGFTPFAATDVGRYIRIFAPGAAPGYGIVTTYTSTSSIDMQVLSELPTALATEDWAFGAFGGEQGYPKCLGFFDGRLIIANTAGHPQTLWLSQSGDLENMQPDTFVENALTVEDDDAIVVTLSSKRIDPIFWLGELNNLVLGTAGSEWAVSSVGGVVTPSDIFAKVNSAIPCADLEVLQISQSLLFADKSKRDIYEMAFSTEESGYIPEFLTILADHIFRSPMHVLAYQRRPNSIIWCHREDGRIATLAYNRAHQVLGWSQQIIGGVFGEGEAMVGHVAVIPGAEDATQVNDSDERDEIWMVVKRTINGATKRYIEVIEGEFEGPLREDYDTESEWWTAMRAAQADAFYVDSGITYDSTSTATITGLTHLEGQVVKVWADGRAQTDKTVSSGQITLDTAASTVQVGLGYTHRYLSLKLPTGSSAGTAVNKVKAITGCGIIVLDTTSFDISSVDHDKQEGRTFHDLYTFEFRMNAMTDLTEAVPLYTGEEFMSLDSNWSTDPRIYIESDAPGPFTLIGLAPHIEGTDET